MFSSDLYNQSYYVEYNFAENAVFYLQGAVKGATKYQ